MTDAIQMAVVFGTMVLITKFIVDYFTRKRLIDKGLVDEKVKFLYNGSSYSRALNNLKWGMVLIGIGIAALAGNFAPQTFDETGTLGLMFVLGGLAFIIYYILLSLTIKKEKDE